MAKLKEDDTNDMRSADEKAVAKMRSEIEGKSAPEASDDDPVIELSSRDEEPDEQDEPEEDRTPRREARRNRYREAQERAEAAERRAQEMQEKLERFLSSQAQQPQTPQPTPRAPEPALDLDAVYAERDNLHREYQLESQAGRITPERQADFQKRARAIEAKLIREAAKGLIAESGYVRQEEIQAQMFRSKHQDVFANQQAVTWARGYYYQELAKGRPDDERLVEESFERAREAFRLSGRGGPSQAERARYTSTPTAGAGAAGRAAAQERATIKMTKEYRRMADEAYKHIKDPMKRYQMWANTVGKNLVK